jgi:hypothetical protein
MAAPAVTKASDQRMLIRIITSCTGEKAVTHEHQLTLADFQQGRQHVAACESELNGSLTPAISMYSGLQHQRLLRGIRMLESNPGAGFTVETWIVSAGYGLIPANRAIAPYEATFIGMNSADRRRWARQLDLPSSVRNTLAQPADLIFLLLGDDYLAGCEIDGGVTLGGPCLLFCGGHAAKRLPELPRLHKIELGNSHAKRFSCGLVGLKGELTSRFLEGLASGLITLQDLEAASNPLDLLEARANSVSKQRSAARANQSVDQVIEIPGAWWNKPHREKLAYFIPEWDDLVDRDFDFDRDIHSGGSGDWSNEVYAHQMYPEPNYDGILISKVVAEKSKKKKERINRLGVHRFLRVPREFPIMGDCGAFGYIQQKTPPYTTAEILDYYTRLDFDLGVSIDHLIVTATEAEKHERYELTIENADAFLREHSKLELQWTPIGAVQGWDAASYAAAAKKYVAMGYQYIGLGGLVRTSTPEILEVLDKVHRVVPERVKVHLFGLARLASLKAFADLGVRSVDSASLLRRAWMGTGQNYLATDGKFYTAIRIPEAGKSFRAKRMVTEGRASASAVERLEARCMEAMRRFDLGEMVVEDVLDSLDEYDRLITPDRPPTRELLRETLEARPWRACPCEICRHDGIQVVIFRGNNRNRRRGFHNTFVFYRLLQRALAGEQVGFLRNGLNGGPQRSLFDEEAVEEVADAL